MGQSQSSTTTATTTQTTTRHDNASTRTLHSASLNSHRPVSFFRRISNRLHVTHPTRRFGRNRNNQQPDVSHSQQNAIETPSRYTSSTTSSVRRATQEARRAAAAVTGPPQLGNYLSRPVNNSSRNSIMSSESTNTSHLLNELLSQQPQQQQQQSSGNSFIQYLQIPLRMQQEINDSASAASSTSRRMHILVIEYRPNNEDNNAPLTPPPTFRFLGLRRPRSEVSTTSSTETIQSMPLSTYSTQTNANSRLIQQEGGQWVVYVLNQQSLISEDNHLTSYEDLLWLSNLLGQVRPNTTTQAAVEEAIPATVWSDDTKKQVNHEQCLVCLDEFALKQQVRILKCHHVFHRECVDRWLCEAHNSCPVCRGVPV